MKKSKTKLIPLPPTLDGDSDNFFGEVEVPIIDKKIVKPRKTSKPKDLLFNEWYDKFKDRNGINELYNIYSTVRSLHKHGDRTLSSVLSNLVEFEATTSLDGWRLITKNKKAILNRFGRYCLDSLGDWVIVTPTGIILAQANKTH